MNIYFGFRRRLRRSKSDPSYVCKNRVQTKQQLWASKSEDNAIKDNSSVGGPDVRQFLPTLGDTLILKQKKKISLKDGDCLQTVKSDSEVVEQDNLLLGLGALSDRSALDSRRLSNLASIPESDSASLDTDPTESGDTTPKLLSNSSIHPLEKNKSPNISQLRASCSNNTSFSQSASTSVKDSKNCPLL